MDIKRKIFFLLDRLQITKRERVAVGTLAITVVLMWFANLLIEQPSNYDPAEYERLQKAFEEQTAEMIREEQQLKAKYKGKEALLTDENITQPSQANENISVNINTATVEELEQLPGIGIVYARRIVEYRIANGPFSSADELVNIKGIGEKRLLKLKPFIKL